MGDYHVGRLHRKMNAKRERYNGQAAACEMPGQFRHDVLHGHTAVADQGAGSSCGDKANHNLDQDGTARRLIEINIAEYEDGAPERQQTRQDRGSETLVGRNDDNRGKWYAALARNDSTRDEL